MGLDYWILVLFLLRVLDRLLNQKYGSIICFTGLFDEGADVIAELSQNEGKFSAK